MEQAIPMAALNNPEKHFSYFRVEAGDITSLFFWALPCFGKRGLSSGSGVEVRVGLLTQLCHLTQALGPFTPQVPSTLTARMLKGL